MEDIVLTTLDPASPHILTYLEPTTKLFSEHYGTYADTSPIRPGQRIRMSAQFLAAAVLPSATAAIARTKTLHAKARVNGELMGGALATVWPFVSHGDQRMARVCWITQLVVHSDHQNKGVATRLLRAIKEQAGAPETTEGEQYVGIASSNPFALAAVVRAFADGTWDSVDLNVIRDNAAAMLEASPVSYLQGARLCGWVFDLDDKPASVVESVKRGNERLVADPMDELAVCCLDTDFHVDHTEPAAALQVLTKRGVQWLFGGLPEGCEYLLILRG